MADEKSIDIFRALSVNRDDLITRQVVKGLELSIVEAHRHMERDADLRVITLLQGCIELARLIIKAITDPLKRAKQ